MELSPQSVASTTFKIVKKGYDPDEVRSYLTQLAASIEQTQSQATAMEARARAAVVRLQEIAAQSPSQPAAAPVPAAAAAFAPDIVRTDEAETISRTLLLAQRTADTTVAEAEAQARSITDTANSEARQVVSGAQDQVSRLIEDARSEARRAGETQRVQVESEVQALLARREFLLSDVDYLEQYIVTQRDRLRDVASSLTDIVDRVPGGLADMRRPLVSAVGESRDSSPAFTPIPDQLSTAAGTMVDESPHTLDTPAEYTDPDQTMPLERVETESVDEVEQAAVMPMVTPDTVWPNGDATDVTPSGSDPESTPPGGSSLFLFEDITAEVPRLDPN
jgi:DivIVA domain-containing protein